MSDMHPMLLGLQKTVQDACDEMDRLRAVQAELLEALQELADSAEADLLANQSDGDGEGGGGWWSLRQEDAIREARIIIAKAKEKT